MCNYGDSAFNYMEESRQLRNETSERVTVTVHKTRFPPSL